MANLKWIWLATLLFELPALPAPAAWPPAAAATNAVAVTRLTWHDAARNRDVPVKIYAPARLTGPFPVILFSHGLGGSREGYGYLGEYWAAHGYVCAHLQHPGTDESIFRNRGWRHVEQTLREAISNPQNSLDRAKDVSFAIDQLTALNEAGGPWHGRLDLTRLGMAGHSFGAATTLMVVGEKASLIGGNLRDPRIKAAIAMSPPAFAGQQFGGVSPPVFVLTGTEDAGFTRTADRRTAFDQIDSPGTCLVIFKGADHMTFSGHLRPGEKAKDDLFHPLILAATTAFWDAHLRGDGPAKTWLEQGGFASQLSGNGSFEQK